MKPLAKINKYLDLVKFAQPDWDAEDYPEYDKTCPACFAQVKQRNKQGHEYWHQYGTVNYRP